MKNSWHLFLDVYYIKIAQPTYITQQILGAYHPADGAKIS